MQTIIQQGKRHAYGMCRCCGHVGEKKALTISKGKNTWYVHLWWQSNCVIQSIYHPKGMYYYAKQVYMYEIKQVKAKQAIKHVKTKQAIKHVNRQAIKRGNSHKANKMQNPSKRESQNESRSLGSPVKSPLSL